MLKVFVTVFAQWMIIGSIFAQQAENGDPRLGDWQSKNGKHFAQVYFTEGRIYKVNITTDLNSRAAPTAVLQGENVNDSTLRIRGDGWDGKIENGKLSVSNATESVDMQQFFRSSPTIHAPPPQGAIVLFDGSHLNAWTKVMERDWLIGGPPADNWKIIPGGILEVVPHAADQYESIITRQKFGDLKLHLEFRLLGAATNGGIYLMSRYEINIKDAYGHVGGSPIGFGNIAKPINLQPDVNPSLPPMQWQTLDIDFRAPRFDDSGNVKTENARMTVLHNGISIYRDVAIESLKGSTAKIGEAAVGPIYLQEHGTAYQFRNIWVIDKTLLGTEELRKSTSVALESDKTNPTEKLAEAMKSGGKKSGGNKSGGNKSGGNKSGGKNGGGKANGKKSAGSQTTEAKPVDDRIIEMKIANAPGIVSSTSKGGSGKKGAGKITDAEYAAESNPAYASTTVVLTPEPSGIPAIQTSFNHPGILVNRLQLEEIKRRVASEIEPQKTAFVKLKNSPLGALDYKANPVQIVSCGPRSNPDLGCKAEQSDSAAAYSQSLLWAITGQEVYANNAIRIMNAWSSTLQGGHNFANGPVQAAWCGSVWPRAAEIIRNTYQGWSDSDVAKFQNMLRTQYLPSIIHGDCENGNKELAMCEALINIGVFLDDRAVFDLGLRMWRGRTPAYVYLKSDGPTPIEPLGCGPAIWSNKGLMPELVNGLLQETARDSHHPWYAFASMTNAAETARNQGLDLYAEEGQRMIAALEFQAQFLSPNNVPVPPNLQFARQPTWEIAFNHFHHRLGLNLPRMAAVIPTNRPTDANHHMLWETLTHGDIGAIGIPSVTLDSK